MQWKIAVEEKNCHRYSVQYRSKSESNACGGFTWLNALKRSTASYFCVHVRPLAVASFTSLAVNVVIPIPAEIPSPTHVQISATIRMCSNAQSAKSSFTRKKSTNTLCSTYFHGNFAKVRDRNVSMAWTEETMQNGMPSKLQKMGMQPYLADADRLKNCHVTWNHMGIPCVQRFDCNVIANWTASEIHLHKHCKATKTSLLICAYTIRHMERRGEMGKCERGEVFKRREADTSEHISRAMVAASLECHRMQTLHDKRIMESGKYFTSSIIQRQQLWAIKYCLLRSQHCDQLSRTIFVRVSWDFGLFHFRLIFPINSFVRSFHS